MIEMRGADAYFLWEESRARHMHTLKVAVVDPSGRHAPLSLDRVRFGIGSLLPYLPAFRRRAVDVPIGLGHPIWIEAPVLDLDYHLRHEVLPAGAGEEGLDQLIGRIASEPLDRDRPLWQIFFVEGLPAGRVAYVTKLHHAVADGSASAALVLHSFDERPVPAAIPPPYAGENEPVPGPARRLAWALRRHLARQRELPGLLWRAIREIDAGRRWRRGGGTPPLPPFTSPETRFNRPITPNRVFAHVPLPLPAMREVKARFGCTLNDVYLALVGGALRGYLELHGELPREPLSAAVPVSVRDDRDDPAFGNATAYWFATTGSDVADPVERLRVVAASTRAARELFAVRDPRLPVDWFDHWILRSLYLNVLGSLGRAVSGHPTYNVIVSNVRGPSRTLYSDGSRLEALYSMGPLSAQQGLNFTAWSYLDTITVGVHACREHVPDVGVLAEALCTELDALRRAAAPPTRAGAAPGSRESRGSQATS